LIARISGPSGGLTGIICPSDKSSVASVFEFFGNFFLALALVGLFRFLWMLGGMLIRTGDAGNAIFAFVLPLLMLYLLGLTLLPMDDWEGFVAGGVLGGVVVYLFHRRKRPSSA